jgi:hypothetical protein
VVTPADAAVGIMGPVGLIIAVVIGSDIIGVGKMGPVSPNVICWFGYVPRNVKLVAAVRVKSSDSESRQQIESSYGLLVCLLLLADMEHSFQYHHCCGCLVSVGSLKALEP